MIEINDGRSRYCSITEYGATFSCWYRPATGNERRNLRRTLKRLDKETARSVACTWIDDHHIYGSIPDFTAVQHWSEQYERAFERLFLIMQGLGEDSTGKVWAKLEEAANVNLANGVRLLRTNPAIAQRSCDDCQKFWYSEKTGQIILVNSTGEKMLRQDVPPCRTNTGCAKGCPENPKALTPENRRALSFYLECDAVGKFPDDKLVRECAVIIKRELARKIVK